MFAGFESCAARLLIIALTAARDSNAAKRKIGWPGTLICCGHPGAINPFPHGLCYLT